MSQRFLGLLAAIHFGTQLAGLTFQSGIGLLQFRLRRFKGLGTLQHPAFERGQQRCIVLLLAMQCARH
jgi:hypothetical protein